MFARKAVQPQTKAAANPASHLAQQRATPVADRFGPAVEQALFLQPNTGNEATLPLLPDQSSGTGENVAVPEATRRAASDFSKVPIFPPGRTNLPEMQFPAQESRAGLTNPASLRFKHNFSRIPIHPPAAGMIQTKLAINEPGDSCEQEADRMAEQVMRTPELRLQHACPCGGGCPNCDQGQPGLDQGSLQTKRVQAGDTGQFAAPPTVHEVLRSPGQPLDPGTRAFMEPRFGYDFSGVRVHSGAAAEQSARDVNAHAYTVRHIIVFGAGQFAPGTRQGRQLIAHELTHVVQQNGGVAAIQRAPGDGTSPAGDPASRVAYQRYLETLREAMAKPGVTDSKLAEIVEKLYRDNPEIGSGSTAAAIRHELATGMPTKGTRHLQAGQDRLNMLADWLKAQKKLRAAGKAAASARDVTIAEHLFLDTQEAVHSGYYADFEITVPPPAGGPGGKVNPEANIPEPAKTTLPAEVAPAAAPEIAEVVATSVFKTAGRFLAREAPGMVLQLVAMALFPPHVNIHNDKGKELSRTKLEPAIQAALEKQELVFNKLLDHDLSQSIYANVTARLDYQVGATSADLEVSLEDMTFLDMKVTNQDVTLSDSKFDTSSRPVSKHVTYSLLLYEPEFVTRDREWAQAQQAYQDCVQRYGTGGVPPAAGAGAAQRNPDEGPCIPPHMKPMEGS